MDAVLVNILIGILSGLLHTKKWFCMNIKKNRSITYVIFGRRLRGQGKRIYKRFIVGLIERRSEIPSEIYVTVNNPCIKCKYKNEEKQHTHKRPILNPISNKRHYLQWTNILNILWKQDNLFGFKVCFGKESYFSPEQFNVNNVNNHFKVSYNEPLSNLNSNYKYMMYIVSDVNDLCDIIYHEDIYMVRVCLNKPSVIVWTKMHKQ